MQSAATINIPSGIDLQNPQPQERIARVLPEGQVTVGSKCFHCGTVCRADGVAAHEKSFCCRGCLTVYELLTENGLDEFYRFGECAGTRTPEAEGADRFRFVDEPGVRQQLVDFSDDRLTRATFRIPAIHCIACVWLLENLGRVLPGLIDARVNFARKELSVSFGTGDLALSDVIRTLARLGYEPELKLSDIAATAAPASYKRLWLQLGIAGFAFGNTMLFSLASYVGLDSTSEPGLKKLIGAISLVLAVPVVAYSAVDYWKSAWISLRQRLLNIDVPIAAGILALFAQSAYEVLGGRGDGYFDTLAGLIFFLLCGRAFQAKTFERLAFDRDYRAFFPLSVRRLGSGGEEQVAVCQLAVGDRIVVRHGELIPADARLRTGSGLIDYSFVSGESEPVDKCAGDHIYAGGRQAGGAIELEVVKPVSQGYLASLWNQEAFRKQGKDGLLGSVTNRYSQRFTRLVLAVAVGSALFWAVVNPALSVKAFTSVLIVACPCALALAAPFTLGAAQRVLARRQVFLKNGSVTETLAAADTIVFDKTGTLTDAQGSLGFHGDTLSQFQRDALCSLLQQSTHPYAVRISQALNRSASPDSRPSITKAGATASALVTDFVEVAGQGIKGNVGGSLICAGSREWLARSGCTAGGTPRGAADSRSSSVWVAFDREVAGRFELVNQVRPASDRLLRELSAEYQVALLSGDNERERPTFEQMLGRDAALRFNQGPLDKLAFVEELQKSGRTVVMVGDGLNDAGALQQSEVGIAVVEKLSAFSPASDVIIAAEMVPALGRVTAFAKSAVGVVRACFVISAVYNIVGISIAARGALSPVICAVLMPVSSITVVGFACAMTAWLGRRHFGPAPSGAERILPATVPMGVAG